MPSNNQIDVNVSIDTPQADFDALQKLTEALKGIPGAQGGGGGRVQQTFPTAVQAGSYLAQTQAAATSVGAKVSGAYVKATAGGFEAGGDVSDGQKKAFSPGGAIGAMATGVGVAVGMFKSLLSMSKIFQTFMSTTGKILGTAVDLMLAPLMPFFMRIMVWLMQRIFPLAVSIGSFIDDFSPVGAAGMLVGGYVALKFGTTLLEKAGASLGTALVNKMPYETFGKNLSAGLSLAAKTLVSWGSTVGGYVIDGVNEGRKALIRLGVAMGGAMRLAFTDPKKALYAIGTAIGAAMRAGFEAGKKVMIAIGAAIGLAMRVAFMAGRLVMIAIGVAIGAAMGMSFESSRLSMIGIGTAIGAAQAGGFIGMRMTMMGIGSSIGLRIGAAFTGMRTAMIAIGSAIGWAIGGAYSGMRTVMIAIGTAIGIGQAGGFIGMKATMVLVGTAIGAAMRAGFMAGRNAMIALGALIGISMGSSAGTSFAASSALGRASTFIGGAIAGAIRTAPAWLAIGGVVAAALGAASIGAAIGYAMWRSYTAHEAGRDIFKGQTEIEIYKNLMLMYGMTDTKALALSSAIAGETPEGELWRDKLSTTTGGFQRFIDAFAEIQLILTKWGVDASGKPRFDLMRPAMSTLEMGEAKFIIKYFEDNKDLFGIDDTTMNLIRTDWGNFKNWFENAATTGTGEVYGKSTVTTENLEYASTNFQTTAAMLIKQDYNMIFREIMNQLYNIKPGEEGDFTKYTKTGWGFWSGKDYTREFSEADIAAGMAVLWQRNPEMAIRFMDPTRREELGLSESSLLWSSQHLDELRRRETSKQEFHIYLGTQALGWDLPADVLQNLLNFLEVQTVNGTVVALP